MASRRDRQEQAVYHVFNALRELKPDLLCNLRDGNNPDQWGAVHLPSIPVIEYARRLHAHWSERPDSGQRLDIVFLPGLRGMYRPNTEAERKWLEAIKANPEPWFVPMPDRQSLHRWLERATEMYRHREQMIFGHGRKRPPEKPQQRNELPRHCEWFVQLAFNPELTPGEIAKLAHVQRETVVAGVRLSRNCCT